MSDSFKLDRNIVKNIRMFSFKDDNQVYTNGVELVPVFRVDQILDVMKVQKLLDKEIPIKVLDVSSNVLFGDLQSIGTCPNCNKEIFMSKNIWYRFVSQYDEDEEVFIRCHHCGQKTDWSEDE